ncbi:MAG: DUF3341 domain-containing protein [Acidobacteriota bacterium]
MNRQEEQTIYGVMARFETPTEVVRAARATHEAGYRKVNAYSPFPIEELSEAIGFHKDHVSKTVLLGGLTGAAAGFALQYFTSVIDYPINVGGRPLFSLPSFVPIIFETGILLAAFGAALGMIIMNNLPQPYHPVFNVPSFKRASRDAFFICIKSNDPKFDQAGTRNFLLGLGAKEVTDVEA